MTAKRACLTAIRVIAVALAGIIISIGATVIIVGVSERQSDRYFRAFCDGKETGRIVSATIIGADGRQVTLDDRDSIFFLTRAFRNLRAGLARKKETVGGWWHLNVTFVGGRCNKIQIDPYIDLSGVEVAYVWADSLWGDDRYYHIDFSEEPPPAVKRALEELGRR